MIEPRPIGRRMGSIALVVLGLIILVILATRQNQTLGLRQTLRLDDFFFTVLEAERLPAEPLKPGPTGSSTVQVNYLVKLKIENRARRVPFKFSGDSLAFADLTGASPLTKPSFERTTSGAMLPPQVHLLQAGETSTIDYVFSLPSNVNVENLRLRLAPGGWSGDLLEWLIFGRKEFHLP